MEGIFFYRTILYVGPMTSSYCYKFLGAALIFVTTGSVFAAYGHK